MTSTLSGPNYEISIEQEYSHYNCEALDPDWKFEDSNGHIHRWVQDGDDWSVPTVEFVVDGVHVIDGDNIEYGHRECNECGDTVRPGHRREDRTVLGMKWIEGTVRAIAGLPLGELIEASRFELPFIGQVVLKESKNQFVSCVPGVEYGSRGGELGCEYSFTSHGKIEIDESLFSHSR